MGEQFQKTTKRESHCHDVADAEEESWEAVRIEEESLRRTLLDLEHTTKPQLQHRICEQREQTQRLEASAALKFQREEAKRDRLADQVRKHESELEALSTQISEQEQRAKEATAKL